MYKRQLRYGIPEFRLPKTVLDDIEYRHLALKGIKIRPNTTIGGAIGIDDLFRDGYKSIFIGTGVWKPNSLHIKGETFGNVHFGINYLNNPDSYHLGETVIVIGAGNAGRPVGVAIDNLRRFFHNRRRINNCVNFFLNGVAVGKPHRRL